MLSMFLTAFQQSLLFLPLTLGIYLTYKVMRVTDLTVEASFVLGAAIFAKLLPDIGEISAVLFGLLGGASAGLAVGFMQTFAKIDSLIASIIAIFMLYSVNFAVMGVPNINLLTAQTLINALNSTNTTVLWIYICVIMLVIIIFFSQLLRSRLGLHLRAYGSNPKLLTYLGQKRSFYLLIGLVLSNGLASLSGMLTAQVNGYTDVSMGIGTALTAIGSLIVGLKCVGRLENAQGRYNVFQDILGAFLGVFVYFVLLNGLLYVGINPVYLKLVLGCFLILFLSSINHAKGEYNDRSIA